MRSPGRARPSRPDQPSLFGEPPALPEGFAYWPDRITPEEERDLAARFADLDFKPFEFQGYVGNRRVMPFGWRYDYGRRQVERAADIPDFLLPLRERAAGAAGLDPQALQQVLVTQYEPGAGIGWHRDRPNFADVIGVSLLSPCLFRFRREAGEGFERISLTLEPRSIYLMRGPSRWDWRHSIPPAKALRYSVTFRSFRDGPPAGA
ncbi:MAG: alpha-ketoglutarate-dependent dioxygenase AlkB [Caulobacteraceae bacterium]